jgi:hypothetical protein
MDLVVGLGISQGLFPMWEENLKRKCGIFFYTIEANSEAELEEKTNQIDNIILTKKKTEELGPEISDGNIAKWHYVEQGHWQMYHNLWGLYPALEPLTAECFTPINTYPDILLDLDQWDMEHNDEIQKITEITGQRPITGSGPVLLVDGCNVELTCGFTSNPAYFNGKYYDIIDEINLKLWKSILERVTKHGVQWYMMGDLMSREMVEIGAYLEDYYKFMESVKKALDPKFILSRGKFHFGGEK